MVKKTKYMDYDQERFFKGNLDGGEKLLEKGGFPEINEVGWYFCRGGDR